MADRDTTTVGNAPTTIQSPTRGILPTHRGWANTGLRTRPLGTITIQVTGGDDAADTFVVNDAGVAICAAVPWTTSHNATAALIAVAINTFRAANPTVSNWVATAATDTVTMRQLRGGAAGTITVTVVGDAAATPANSGNVSNDTNSWTEFVSGATFDGDLYYELGWSGALAAAYGDNADLTNARVIDITLMCDGQAVQLWSGGIRANTGATALVQGIPLATTVWAHEKLGGYLPWLDAALPLAIKVASDEEVLYLVRYI